MAGCDTGLYRVCVFGLWTRVACRFLPSGSGCRSRYCGVILARRRYPKISLTRSSAVCCVVVGGPQ